MDTTIYNALKRVVAYIHDDEEADCLDNGSPDNHIYHDIVRVARWLDEVEKEHTDICEICKIKLATASGVCEQCRPDEL